MLQLTLTKLPFAVCWWPASSSNSIIIQRVLKLFFEVAVQNVQL